MLSLASVLTCVSWVLQEADPQEELGAQGFIEPVRDRRKEVPCGTGHGAFTPQCLPGTWESEREGSGIGQGVLRA